MITTLETNIENVRNKKELKELLEKVLNGKEINVDKYDVGKGNVFLNYNAYLENNETTLILVQSRLNYLNESKINIKEMKEDLKSVCSSIEACLELWKIIIMIMIYVIILDIVCISIVIFNNKNVETNEYIN